MKYNTQQYFDDCYEYLLKKNIANLEDYFGAYYKSNICNAHQDPHQQWEKINTRHGSNSVAGAHGEMLVYAMLMDAGISCRVDETRSGQVAGVDIIINSVPEASVNIKILGETKTNFSLLRESYNKVITQPCDFIALVHKKNRKMFFGRRKPFVETLKQHSMPTNWQRMLIDPKTLITNQHIDCFSI